MVNKVIKPWECVSKLLGLDCRCTGWAGKAAGMSSQPCWAWAPLLFSRGPAAGITSLSESTSCFHSPGRLSGPSKAKLVGGGGDTQTCRQGALQCLHHLPSQSHSSLSQKRNIAFLLTTFKQNKLNTYLTVLVHLYSTLNKLCTELSNKSSYPNKMTKHRNTGLYRILWVVSHSSSAFKNHT